MMLMTSSLRFEFGRPAADRHSLSTIRCRLYNQGGNRTGECYTEFFSGGFVSADRPILELIRRARDGDREALAVLLERYREFVRLVVHGRARGRLRARLDSSDMIQETLLHAAKNIQQFEGSAEEELRAWLGRIAEREVIHQMRRHLGAEKRAVAKEQPLVPADDSASGRDPGPDQRLGKMPSSPSMALMRKERALLLSGALSRLPDDYREVLRLRNLEGLEFPEIAVRLQRSAGAVRVLWVRALRKLREELAKDVQCDSRGPEG